MTERGTAEIRFMPYHLTTKFYDQPDRFLDVTVESLSTAILGRKLASVLAQSSAPIANFSEPAVIGKCSKKSFRKVIFDKTQIISCTSFLPEACQSSTQRTAKTTTATRAEGDSYPWWVTRRSERSRNPTLTQKKVLPGVLQLHLSMWAKFENLTPQTRRNMLTHHLKAHILQHHGANHHPTLPNQIRATILQ